MKKALAVAASLLMVFAVYLAKTTVGDDASSAMAKGAVYSGTIYVAGMGGHFSAADVEVDPSANPPIKVKNLKNIDDRIVIGDKDSHPTHDARIDSEDKTKMYWSTYKTDKHADGRKVHVGVTDLKTGKVIKDVTYELPERAMWIGALYCGSGQSKSAFLPVTMSNEAFIDVFDKKSLDLKHRVYLDSLGYKDNYFFFHGTNSPDMKTFAVSINMTEQWAKADAPANRLGKIDMVLLDLPELEKGNVKVLTKNTITGSPASTLTFRQTFSPDGKYLLQSGGDRMYLLDGKTMKLLDEEMMTDGENHDAMATPDGKYAILTLRTKINDPEGKQITDGTLQLYDMESKKLVGGPVSVCYTCHKEFGIGGNSILCGLDGNMKVGL